MIQTAAQVMSEAEYIQHELQSERRSEYINGPLFEMPGAQDLNNYIAQRIFLQLHDVEEAGYFFYLNDIKVAIPGGKKFLYPDLILTAEPQHSEESRFVKREPVLIVEVVSEGTQKTDYVDKLIEYTKIPSLQYYLTVEPEIVQITVCGRDREDWMSHKYTNKDERIELTKLNASLPLSTIYKHIRP